jgi:hypothetical protein
MIRLAANMTDDEVKATAIYFSSMKWTPWIRVVETSDAPKTRVQFGMFLKLEGFTNIRGGLFWAQIRCADQMRSIRMPEPGVQIGHSV